MITRAHEALNILAKQINESVGEPHLLSEFVVPASTYEATHFTSSLKVGDSVMFAPGENPGKREMVECTIDALDRMIKLLETSKDRLGKLLI